MRRSKFETLSREGIAMSGRSSDLWIIEVTGEENVLSTAVVWN